MNPLVTIPLVTFKIAVAVVPIPTPITGGGLIETVGFDVYPLPPGNVP